MYSNNVFLCVKILANRLFDLIIVMIAFNDLHTRKIFFLYLREFRMFCCKKLKVGARKMKNKMKYIWFGRLQFHSFI